MWDHASSQQHGVMENMDMDAKTQPFPFFFDSLEGYLPVVANKPGTWWGEGVDLSQHVKNGRVELRLGSG